MSDEALGIISLGVERGSVQVVSRSTSDVELFSEPKYETPDEDGETGTVLPDDLAELEIVRIYHESDGSGSFYLHNGDGTRIGPSYSYSRNSGTYERGGFSIGAGNRVCASVTVTTGTLRIWVEVQTRRRIHRKRVIEYPDA